MAKAIDTYSETITAVYHPKIINGKLTRVLKGVFAQETEVVFEDSTSEIFSQNSAGQREANAGELKEFYNAENADLITQAQQLKKDYEAKEEARTAEIEQVKSEIAKLKAGINEL